MCDKQVTYKYKNILMNKIRSKALAENNLNILAWILEQQNLLSTLITDLEESVSLPTVPARVTFWFLKSSRASSIRNPPEDVHVTAGPKMNVLSLHHPSLCINRAEL